MEFVKESQKVIFDLPSAAKKDDNDDKNDQEQTTTDSTEDERENIVWNEKQKSKNEKPTQNAEATQAQLCGVLVFLRLCSKHVSDKSVAARVLCLISAHSALMSQKFLKFALKPMEIVTFIHSERKTRVF